LAKLEPGSLLVLVCAPPLVRRAVPGQVPGWQMQGGTDNAPGSGHC